MGKRSYDQFCALARSLDIIGQRWTLLIVRELLTGPKRFKNLMANLPGIGTNLLSNRLDLLVEENIIEKVRLPPPASVQAYDLTEHGKGLEDVILSIIKWGQGYLNNGLQDDYVRASWAIVGLKSYFQPKNAVDVNLTCQFRVEDEYFWIRVENKTLSTREGTITDPDITFTSDLETFVLLANAESDLERDIAEGKIQIDGNQEKLHQFLQAFKL